jgi:hypothetical protein
MVALECTPEMIGSEMTQQADSHFDFLSAIPIINHSHDMVLLREDRELHEKLAFPGRYLADIVRTIEGGFRIFPA